MKRIPVETDKSVKRLAQQGSRWKIIETDTGEISHHHRSESRDSGAPLSRSPSLSGRPSTLNDADSHRAKLAGDSFHPDELYELNGADFWRDWERAGGDPDEYFKETLPNYGLVGSLFMTISIPATLEPPSFGFNGQGEPDKNEFYVSIFVIMMCITTVISLISVLLAICIHQQYINAYSKSLRVDFAARYGYLVGVLTSLLVIDALALFFGMACAMCTMFRLDASILGLCIMFVGGMWAVMFYVSITTWNANHYSKQMVIDIQRVRQEDMDDDSAPFAPSPGGVRRMSSSKMSMFDIVKFQRQAYRRQVHIHAVHPSPACAEDTADVDGFTYSDSTQDSRPALPRHASGQLGETVASLETLQRENDRTIALLRSSSVRNKSPVQYDGRSYSAVESE